MKHREPRKKVMVPARIRADAAWSEACILDLSSRGMLVRARKAPPRGTYLEIRRGLFVIIARVVWTNADRFGVQTQDAIPADELIRGSSCADLPAKAGTALSIERRATHRPAVVQHEASRWRARAFEFGSFALVGMVAATLGLGAVDALLARPLSVVQAALGGR